jgi:Spy/CpxP family protein refolding chaperone
MYTVEMLSESLELARQLGYQIREDQLEGAGGGHCLIRGHKWLLLDITQSADDQLRDVLDAIRGDFSASGQLLQDRLQAGPPQISPELAKALADNEPETLGTRQRAA